MNSRWACGPLATAGGSFRFNNCDVELSLNYYRYVRQLQIGEFPTLPTSRGCSCHGGNSTCCIHRCTIVPQYLRNTSAPAICAVFSLRRWC